MRARRGCNGRSTIARPVGVGRPASSIAPRRPSSSVASARAVGGGGSRKARASAVAPQTASSRANPARSAAAISGGANGRRAACSPADHRRKATPGPSRPARPARWTADACEAAVVCSRLSPLRASWRGRRTSPPSTTIRTPSTVRLDSAMSVASTTRRRPGGDGARARSCSSGRRLPCSGRTSTAPGRSASNPPTRRMAAAPGRNTSTSPASSRTASWTTAAMASSGPDPRSGRPPTDVDGVGATGAGHHRRRSRRPAQQDGQPAGLERGRHGQQPEVRA